MHAELSKSILISCVFLDVSSHFKDLKIRNPRFSNYCIGLKNILDFHKDMKFSYITSNSLFFFIKTLYFNSEFDIRSKYLRVISIIDEFYELDMLNQFNNQANNLIDFYSRFLNDWEQSHSDFLGHESVQTTEIYARANMNLLQKAIIERTDKLELNKENKIK